MFGYNSPKAIREPRQLGEYLGVELKAVQESCNHTKRTTIEEHHKAHGLINARDFGGTKKWRTCYTSDATGHTMLYGVANRALRDSVDIKERKELLSLIVEDDRCFGR